MLRAKFFAHSSQHQNYSSRGGGGAEQAHCTALACVCTSHLTLHCLFKNHSLLESFITGPMKRDMQHLLGPEQFQISCDETAHTLATSKSCTPGLPLPIILLFLSNGRGSPMVLTPPPSLSLGPTVEAGGCRSTLQWSLAEAVLL